MPFAAALSTLPRTDQAIDEVCSGVASRVVRPDLAIAFFSPHHADEADEISRQLHLRLSPRVLLGCIGEAVIGNDREIEEKPALSLWLGRWSEPLEVDAFHLVLERTSEGFTLLGWPDALVGANPARSALLVLGDPFT